MSTLTKRGRRKEPAIVDRDIDRLNSELESINQRIERMPKESSFQKVRKYPGNIINYGRISSHPMMQKEVLFVIMLIIATAGLFFMKGGITGWLVGGESQVTYSQEIDSNITESQEMTWTMEEHPQDFILRSVKLTGRLKGSGSAKVYLEGTDGLRYLILDEDEIQEEGLRSVTAYMVNVDNSTGDNTTTQDNTSSDAEGNTTEEENTEEETGGEENTEEESAEESAPETAIEKEITTELAYQTGTRWDPDDDGIEDADDGVVDFTVEDTAFSWDADESKLCTKWIVSSLDGGTDTTVCNGASDCCMLAGVAPEEPDWDTPLYLFHSKYGAGYNNTVTAQVVFLNQSLDGEVYLESEIGTSETLDARFLRKPVFDFSDICIQTCSLHSTLSSTEYTLTFELDEGIEIYIENITYALENLTEDAGEAGELNRSDNTSTNETDQNVTVEITPEIKDTEGNTLAATVEFKDRENRRAALKRIEARTAADNAGGRTIRGRIRGAISQGDGSADEKVNLTKGSYKVEIEFEEEDLPVKRIAIEDANISENSTGFLKLDDVEEEGELAGFEEVYAIDPTEINFTNATVTSQAKGGWLYKCRDWDFENQECPELRRECTGNTKETRNCTLYGGWQRVQELQPGQEYSFTLTPADPGYAEYNSTYGAPYCEDGNSPCTADSSDLKCRDSVSDGNGPEPNQPNTIDSCPDGTTTYASPSCGGDESVENITITDLDSSTFSPGDTVQVEAWVHCYSASDDKVAVVYTSDASSPSWTVKEYKACSQADSSGSYHKETFTAFDLDATSGDHAVRVYVQYLGESGETCADSSGGTGTYDDNDDVVFTVGTPNSAPTHSTPLLTSSGGTDTTDEDLTVYNQSTNDTDGDSVKNIINWYKDGTSINVLNMPFEGGSTASATRDYSGYSNDGTVSGPTWVETGGYDGFGAYDFDSSSDSITVADDSTIELTDNGYTIAAWIYPESFGGNDYGRIVQKSDGSTMGTIFYLSDVLSGTQTYEGMRLYHDGSGTYAESNDYVIDTNTWQHVAVTYSGTTAKFYVDGTDVTEVSSIGTYVPDTSSTLYIGNRGDLARAFDGKIDDLVIFNHSLTPEQVQSLYQNGMNTIVSEETTLGDVWKAAVTPNDGTTDGSTLESNTLTITSPGSSPLPHYAGFEADEDGWTFSDAPSANPDSNRSDAGSNRQDDGSAGGSWSAHLQDNSADSYFSQAFDFSENTSYLIAFYYYPNSIDSGEFASMYCDDTEIWRFTNGDHAQDSWNTAEIYITSDNCTLDSDMTIKWNGSGLTGNVDNLWVDGINITATSPDTTAPAPVTGLSESSTGKTWITWGWTNPGDADFDSAILYLNGTNVANTSSDSHNFTGLSGFTTYSLTVHTKDATGNVNTSDVTDNAMTQDNIAPQYSGIVDANGTAYSSGGSYQFNITWTDNVAVNDVTFSFDGTNYTPSSSGSEYYKTLTDLAAGSYSYTWYAEDFLENEADTGTRTFVLAKADSTIDLLLNGSDDNLTEAHPIDINITAETTTGDDVEVSIYRNGTQISSGTPPLTNVSTYSTAATYNITAIYAESQNYTAGSDTQWLTIEDQTPPSGVTNLGESGAGTDWIRWIWTNPGDADFESAILYLNGTNVANTSSNYYNASGLSGYTSYRLTVNTKDTSGNLNTTDVWDNAMTLDNIAPQYTGMNDQNNSGYAPGGSYQFNITWTDNVAVNDVTFSFDGTNYTNPTNTGDEYYISMSDIAAGSHTYRWYAEDFLSNMNSTAETEFVVAKATPSLTLSSVGGWSKEYGLTSNVNCSTTSPGVSAALYRNGTGVSNPDVQTHGASTYEYICNTTETQNYTAGSAENNLTITKASSSVNLLLNGTDSNLTIERLSDANLTGETLTGDDVAIILYVNSTGSGTGASPVSNISTYSEQADHNITLAYPGSQNYTASSETHWLKVRDTTPPGSVSGPAEQSRGSSWITWNWTVPADSDYSEAIIYLNGTNVANVSGNSYNATGLATYTVYWITIHTKDGYGNVNDTGVSDTARTLDEIPPSYSGINDNNGTVYSQGGNYQFNITWTDNVEVGSVTFSFDGTNYTSPTQSGNEYYVTLTDLAAGSYSYKWYATDSAGNQNETGAQNFEIVKASTTMNISILPGWNETYGTETTVTCSADNDEVTATLWRDGAQASIPDTQTPGGGNYTYVCNASSTTNYTAGTASDELTINRAEPDISLLLNGTESNMTIEVGGAVNETGMHDHPCILSLYEAGSLITSSSSPVTQITEYNTPGTYNVTLQHPLTQNHTAAQVTHWITVQDSTEPEVTLISPEDGQAIASQEQEFMFNFTDNHYSTADCTLYVNGNESGSHISAAAGSTISITNSTLPEGQDEWHINCTDGSGNTGQSGTRNIDVDVTAPTITAIAPAEGEIIGYISTFDIHAADDLTGVHHIWYEIRNSSGTLLDSGQDNTDDYEFTWNTTSHADGNYTFIAYVNDTVGNTRNLSVGFMVSNTQPFIQILVPEYDDEIFNTDFSLNINYQDNELVLASYNITDSEDTAIQSNSTDISNLTSFTFTDPIPVGSLADGNYTIHTYANDSTSYEVRKNRTFIIDMTPPAYSATYAPTDPSTYSAGASYTFNSTWNDTYGMETVKLEFDGVNYTASNGGSTYTNTLSGLAAGTYTYRWHGQDEAGNRNSTEEETFTILQASSSCTLSFDKSSPQTYGTSITAECVCTNPETDGLLWRDSTYVTGSEDGSAVILAAGSYDYACNSSETQNYTAATDSGVFAIDKAVTTMNISVLPSWNETYGTETTVNCAADNDEVTATLWRDGAQVSIPDTSTLAAGSHEYECNASSTTNYTNSTASDTLNIDKAASSVSLLINGSASDQTIERTAAANLTASRVTGTGPVQLLRNGTLLGSGDAVSDVSTYDVQTLYNITAYYPATQNHSSSQQTLWLTVNDTAAPGAVTNLLMLNRGQNYIYWVWTNPDDEDFDHVDVYVNDSYMTSTSGEYHYATGLDHSSDYKLSVRTVDTSGVYGEWVNDTQRTAYNCTEDWQVRYGECNLNDTRLKWYEDAANCGIYYNLPADNGTMTRCDCVVSTEYDGNTTNLTGNDLTGISGVVLEVDGVGKIEFRQEVNITRCIDLDTYAGIGRTYARIDSEDIPELNRSAQITLYNITYNNPIITVNGSQCPASRCAEINHTNSTYIFNVTHFTRYTVEEGPYCGDGSCDTGSGERCSNCPADCGSCGITGGGGGGGGSTPSQKPCEPNWLCYSWGPCTDYVQTRSCFDANACGNETEKPVTERTCITGCAERWACVEWSKCSETGIQTRVCRDLSKCGTENSKPKTIQSCEYQHCGDGKHNGDEEGIDCGGSCNKTCPAPAPANASKNMLTGNAITVQPFEMPNPINLLPLLLLLLLMGTIIALRKTNLPARFKKALAITHIVLMATTVVLAALIFDAPAMAGRAVTNLVEETGLPAATAIMGASAIVIIAAAIYMFRRKRKKRYKPNDLNKDTGTQPSKKGMQKPEGPKKKSAQAEQRENTTVRGREDQFRKELEEINSQISIMDKIRKRK